MSAPVPAKQAVSGKKKKNFERDIKKRYDGRRDPRRMVKQKTRLRWPQLIFMILLLAALVAVGLFSWDRWFRYDDTRDVQGQWVLADNPTSASVVINGSTIRLTEDVEYSYTLDTWAKTISFTFGNESGSGVYRFSADRSTLVIADGAEGDLFTDIKVALDMVEPDEGFDPENTSVLVGRTELPPGSQAPTSSVLPNGDINLANESAPPADGDDQTADGSATDSMPETDGLGGESPDATPDVPAQGAVDGVDGGTVDTTQDSSTL